MIRFFRTRRRAARRQPTRPTSRFTPQLEILESRQLLAALTAGDIAFTGFQGSSNDKISFVLLKDIDDGTVLSITDNAWSGSQLASNEGTSVISFGADFQVGVQFNFDASRSSGNQWAVGSDTTGISDSTSEFFALRSSGDNLLAYNGTQAPTSGNSVDWVAAFATNAFLSSGNTNTSRTYLPNALTLGVHAKTVNLPSGSSNQNAALTAPATISGTAIEIAAAVNDTATWQTFTTANGQPIPSQTIFNVSGSSNNQSPTGLTLSSTQIDEGQPINTLVGQFMTTDPNAGDTFTYSLVSGQGDQDNNLFNIVGDELRSSQVFDATSTPSLDIRVRTTDQGGLFFEQTFTVSVVEVGNNSGVLRIVSYNIAASDGNIRSGLDTILEAIGSEIFAGLSQPIDVLALQEVENQASTTSVVAGLLNSIYQTTAYAFGTLNAASTGSGTQGVVYNSQRLQLLGETTVGTASTSGPPRQGLRYHFQPIGGDTDSDFYLYNSHWKSLDDSTSADRRHQQAIQIRNDADALGDGQNIIYVGDFNTYRGSEQAIQEMLSTGSGQAFDPIDRIGEWHNNSSFVDVMTQAPSTNPPSGLAGGGLDDRFDWQMNSGELADGIGLEYVPGSYRAFGNNGSVSLNSSINASSSTALPGLSNRLTVLNLLTTVTDHLPVVADYSFSSPSVIDAVNDFATTSSSSSVAIDALANDTPVSDIVVTNISQPADGTAIVQPNGDIIFTPNQGFSGTAQFDYSIALKEAELSPSGASVGDRFGYSVDISGDIAVVGAYLDDPTGVTNAGSAYVFERTDLTSWTQIAQLNGDLDPTDVRSYFGWSVAVDGDTVIVGAQFDQDLGFRSGSAYVFERNAGGTNQWGRVAKLLGSDVDKNDYFGRSIDIDGDTIVVGASISASVGAASGAAYVFERNAGGTNNWGQTRKLVGSSLSAGDRFGQSVAIDENTIAVGAFQSDLTASNAGAVYVFDRNTGGLNNWGEVTSITPADGIASDFFGYSVDLDGQRLAVGAPHDDENGQNQIGSIYLFEQNSGGANTWGQETKLLADDAVAGDRLGWSVGISGDRIVGGAVQADIGGDRSGSAYLFERNGMTWEQTRSVVNSQVSLADEYGVSVGIDADAAVIGSWLDNRPLNNSGGAYIYDLRSDTATISVNVTANSANSSRIPVANPKKQIDLANLQIDLESMERGSGLEPIQANFLLENRQQGIHERESFYAAYAADSQNLANVYRTANKSYRPAVLERPTLEATSSETTGFEPGKAQPGSESLDGGLKLKWAAIADFAHSDNPTSDSPFI